YGDSVSMTDTVTPSGATGGVNFVDITHPLSPVILGTGSLGGSPTTATFSTSSLGAGSYFVIGAYGGDATHEGSNSNSSGLNVSKADTTTALAASPESSVFGQEATFTATVSGPGTIGGQVQFKDGSTNLGGLATVSGGQAVLKVSTLPVGPH